MLVVATTDHLCYSDMSFTDRHKLDDGYSLQEFDIFANNDELSGVRSTTLFRRVAKVNRNMSTRRVKKDLNISAVEDIDYIVRSPPNPSLSPLIQFRSCSQEAIGLNPPFHPLSSLQSVRIHIWPHRNTSR